jgi:acyl-CoA dehydrogenase
MLPNPHRLTRRNRDDRSAEMMGKTIEFFENRGKVALKRDEHDRVWPTDFLDFVRRERIFATLLTPTRYGHDDCRWDTYRICELSEILAFYGLPYWYPFQVTVLGLGPIWMSGNEDAKRQAAARLEAGEVFAFGLSERAHGADVYSTDMVLTPGGDGGYRAKRRVGRYPRTPITAGPAGEPVLAWYFDQDAIDAEAAADGWYALLTNLTSGQAGSAGVFRRYKGQQGL